MSIDKNRQVPIHLNEGFPIITTKTMRNNPCLCGSGKKQKHCCGVKTEFYTTKPKRELPDQSSYIDEALKEKYGIDSPEHAENAVTQADASQNT